MKRSCRTLLSLLLTLTVLLCMAVPAAFADGPAASGPTGRLSIQLRAPDDSITPIHGGVFELFYVGIPAVGPAGDFFRLTPAFADCGVLIDDLAEEGMAEHLAAYTRNHGLTGTVNTADSTTGFAVFDDLAEGLYLVCQKGTIDGWKQSKPFFIPMPFVDDSGNASYDVVASPKIEPLPDTPTGSPMRVYKRWLGRNKAPDAVSVVLFRDGLPYDRIILNADNNWTYVWPDLSDDHVWSISEDDVHVDYSASYIWDDSETSVKNSPTPRTTTEELTVTKKWDDSNDWEGKRPDSITVQLYQDGGLYDSVVLNEANNWTYHWTGLPQGSTWAMFELDVPESYEVSYSVKGSYITITNHNPPPPPLIQTGQLNWPVPLMAAAGLMLFALGWVMTRHGGKAQNETQDR